jgi:uncharacterized protein (UPF0261 family)
MADRVVAVAGALDTKSEDYEFLKGVIEARDLKVLLIDFGVLGNPALKPDVGSEEVARAGGDSLADLRATQDKTRAMRAMTEGLAKVVAGLHAEGRIHGIISMGGSGGTAVATNAMRTLPVGFPKVMVSTVAGGDVAAYVGTRDIVMMPSVVDVAGLNRISREIYTNAGGAIAGMVLARAEATAAHEQKPVVVASMFGNTTECVDRARHSLEKAGYEVLVFHATGTGGRTMESLVADGFVDAVADITTTELADEVVGGVLNAGPDRLFAAARKGLPTVLVPGCVDMANFWAADTVPEKYRGRKLYEWNANVTLMRTNVAENRHIGEWIARAANDSKGPVAVVLPLKGVSMLDSPGGEFWDPEADSACFDAIRSKLRPDIAVVEMNANINDPAFADKIVETLLGLVARNRGRTNEPARA